MSKSPVNAMLSLTSTPQSRTYKRHMHSSRRTTSILSAYCAITKTRCCMVIGLKFLLLVSGRTLSAAVCCYWRSFATTLATGSFAIFASWLQADSRTSALDPTEWRKCEVLHKEKVNHDSVKLRLGFDDHSAVSGLTTASCLLLRAPIGSQKEDGTKANVIRPYTPISDSETRYAHAHRATQLGHIGSSDVRRGYSL